LFKFDRISWTYDIKSERLSIVKVTIRHPSSNDELILVDKRPIFNLHQVVLVIVIDKILSIFRDVLVLNAVRFDSKIFTKQDFISEYWACVSVGFERIEFENG